MSGFGDAGIASGSFSESKNGPFDRNSVFGSKSCGLRTTGAIDCRNGSPMNTPTMVSCVDIRCNDDGSSVFELQTQYLIHIMNIFCLKNRVIK